MNTLETFQPVVVHTPLGAIQGSRCGAVASFHRVPYAEPPLGERRFAAPQAVSPWDGTKDCTQTGVIPPQLPSRLRQVMGDYPMPQDEDCLHLDIWSREDGIPGKPVLVFLHGGGFMSGGGATPCYDGRRLAEQQGLLVINVTYRLGALGFLPLPGIATANLGLRDQAQALRCIGLIAASFGGDPTNITVLGQSAGAYSIAALLANPATRGLFRRAAMLSAPFGDRLRSSADMARQAERFLSLLGVAQGDRAAACALPVADILRAQAQMMQETVPQSADLMPIFMPVADGDTIAGSPAQALAGGAARDTDLLIGSTRDEMLAFYVGNERIESQAGVLLERLLAQQPAQPAGTSLASIQANLRAQRVPGDALHLLSALQSDLTFTRLGQVLAEGHCAHGGRAYVYRFDWQAPQSGFGACHCLELPFVFGNLAQWAQAPMLAGASREAMRALSRAVQTAIAAFARHGQPKADGLADWPLYGQQHITLLFDHRIEAVAMPCAPAAAGEVSA